MMLPSPDDVPALAAKCKIPPAETEELIRLARKRVANVRVVSSASDSYQRSVEVADLVRETTLWSLFRAPGFAIEWPWRKLQALIDSMLAGDVWLIGARTGVGKTTALMNVVNAMILRMPRVAVKVIPFETPPWKITNTLAAIRLGYDPRLVLRGRWDELPGEAHEAIAGECDTLTGGFYRDTLFWTPQGTLGQEQVIAELERGHDMGARVVVLDHLHRVALPGRRPEPVELRDLMRALKDTAERLELVLLCGAQLSRGDRDPLKRYTPPLDTDLRGAGALEEEADGILGMYLPLKPTISFKQITAIRRNLLSVKPFVLPGRTAMRVLKSRMDGERVVGADVILRYDNGRLLDDDQPSTET